MTLKIGVLGCAGRMGQAIIKEVVASDGCTLAGGTERAGHPEIGKDLGALAGLDDVGLVVSENASALIATADTVIEFSTIEATVRHAALAAEHGTAHVIGTTGLDDQARNQIVDAAARTRLFGRRI